MNNPKISIITPVYNREHILAKAIESVAMQDYPNFEHIIVDDGSTDGTAEVIKRYEGKYPMRWFSQKNGGPAAAMDAGFRAAEGEIFAWLDSDDFYNYPQMLSDYARTFMETGADIVVADLTVMEEDEKEVVKPDPLVNYERLVNEGCIMLQAPSFFRRKFFELAGGFDSTYKLAGDYEFWIRVFKHNPKVAYMPKNVATYFRSPVSILVSNPWRSWYEGFAIGERHGRSRYWKMRQYVRYLWERFKYPVAKFVKKRPGLYAWYKKHLRSVVRRSPLNTPF